MDNVTPVDDTIPARFLRTVTARQDDVALREKVGEVERHLTFGGYADRPPASPPGSGRSGSVRVTAW